MNITKPKFSHHVLVCENLKEQGECCGATGKPLRLALKKAIAELGLAAKVRVSGSGCLGACTEGPNVLLMPDNIWFSGVSEADLDALLAEIVQRVTPAPSKG